jgi:hypothetical protein
MPRPPSLRQVQDRPLLFIRTGQDSARAVHRRVRPELLAQFQELLLVILGLRLPSDLWEAALDLSRNLKSLTQRLNML